MKNTFKKIFKILYGCDDNIKYKIISTLFITSVIETILSFMYKDNAFLSNLFSNFSVIKRQESQEFVREFNQNKVTNDFLESCKKAGKLFGKRK